MDNNRLIPEKKGGTSAQSSLIYLAVCIMMVCFSIIIVNTVNSAIPTWNGTYLVILAFLVAAESLTTNRLIKKSTILNANPVAARISEWIVILIVVKMVKYLISNPAKFLTDINLWRHDFMSFFMNDDYALICIFLFLIWLLSLAFGNCLDNLEGDKSLLDLERQGYARTNRLDARRGIMGIVFGMGLAMLFFTTISNITLPIIVLRSKSVSLDIALILLFFLMGFIVLAQSQFSILKSRWYIENIPINPLVSSRWISYSILVVVIVAFLALLLSFLPSNYTLGFFDLIRSGLNFLFAFFAILQLVCFAPILALLSLLVGLFGKTLPPSAPAIQIPTPIPPSPTPPAAPSSWLELVKSIIFWAIFLFVIFYAFRHYFSQRQDLLNGLRRFPLWPWLKKAVKWLTANFWQVNHQLSKILDAGVARFQTFIRPKPIHIDPLLTISSRLPPRQRILLIYLSMIHWNNRNGFPRKGNQTPFEYARSLDSSIPDSKNDLDTVTQAFIEARYTRHPLTHAQADLVQTALERLQSIFREYLEHQSQNHIKENLL
jgi:hypothetical protein